MMDLFSRIIEDKKNSQNDELAKTVNNFLSKM